MDTELRKHLDKILDDYSRGDHYQSLIEAKREYFELTGLLHEDDLDFEKKMNCFNDWYIFDFQADPLKSNTVIKDYIERTKPEEDVAKSLTSVNYSLFEFVKTTLKKQVVLKDILHSQKILLSPDHFSLGLISGDVFVGRVVTYRDRSFLLNGICNFPKEVRSILNKQSKRVRKLQNPTEEVKFLLTLEHLKTKWIRYGHVNLQKIFVFDT